MGFWGAGFAVYVNHAGFNEGLYENYLLVILPSLFILAFSYPVLSLLWISFCFFLSLSFGLEPSQ